VIIRKNIERVQSWEEVKEFFERDKYFAKPDTGAYI
jgi:hypothetical protein